ncbi:hypothetical protein HPB50_015373 [Hyalomma asiaticum]|uniref:Uncharacterized protein n=1 Tax=Hyalomma asiaticum TaxID=266040 RepID=A0ACB7TN72_HYAAI|nr:hypothetical protein HPB50_015373 [Hyalomma asiaticum]
MPTYGVLETFHGEGAAWTEYLERVKLFFDANSVPEEKKKSVFLTCCGSSTYSLLRSLLTPRAPDQKLLCDASARKDPLPQPGDRVFTRNIRPGPAWLAGTVTKPTSSSSVQVQLENGDLCNRHGDHIRHAANGTPAACRASKSEPPTAAIAREAKERDSEADVEPPPPFVLSPQQPAFVPPIQEEQQSSMVPNFAPSPGDVAGPHLRRSTRSRKPVTFYRT